jgi:hypothetical protein
MSRADTQIEYASEERRCMPASYWRWRLQTIIDRMTPGRAELRNLINKVSKPVTK